MSVTKKSNLPEYDIVSVHAEATRANGALTSVQEKSLGPVGGTD